MTDSATKRRLRNNYLRGYREAVSGAGDASVMQRPDCAYSEGYRRGSADLKSARDAADSYVDGSVKGGPCTRCDGTMAITSLGPTELARLECDKCGYGFQVSG